VPSSRRPLVKYVSP
jgi:ATP-dependent 26S proteasome regulatory subunit